MGDFKKVLKQWLEGYYNYTPPKTFKGDRKPHFTNKEYQRGAYWNTPKLWGNSEAIGVVTPDSVYTQPTRFYQEKKYKDRKQSLLDLINNIN